MRKKPEYRQCVHEGLLRLWCGDEGDIAHTQPIPAGTLLNLISNLVHASRYPEDIR
jgi:hypothetical protein